MLKRFSFVAIFLLSVIAMFAESSNPFYDIFRHHFPKDCDPNETNIISFIGDSIYFEVVGNTNLTNVLIEEPDTIWLKEKRSRNPKEGKDYSLCYNYKGVKEGDKFATPVSEFIGKTFGLLSANPITIGGVYRIMLGYNLTLLEPQTSSVIHIELKFPVIGEWRLYSKSTNSKIQELMNIPFYNNGTYGYKDYKKYLLTSGDLYLKFSSKNGKFLSEPHAEFILTSTDDSPMELTFDSNKLSHLENIKFISKAEYDTYIENKRVSKINYEYPTDTFAIANIANEKFLPFNIISGKVISGVKVYQTLAPEKYKNGQGADLNKNTSIFVADKETVRGVDYYKAALDGKAFFIESSCVTIDEPAKLDTIMSKPQELRDAFLDYAKVYSHKIYKEQYSKLLDKHNKLFKQEIVIYEAAPYDVSVYTTGTGVRFEFLNNSDKTIKYTTFNFVGLNAVGDAVPLDGQNLVSLRAVGPISPHESNKYYFDYVWLWDHVHSIKLRSVVVQYTNGTSKTFSGNVINIPDEKIINLETSQVRYLLPKFDDDKK